VRVEKYRKNGITFVTIQHKVATPPGGNSAGHILPILAGKFSLKAHI
jgi:hypothetical protein